MDTGFTSIRAEKSVTAKDITASGDLTAKNIVATSGFKASGTAAVTAADATAAANDDGPTKAEFDAVVTLANELKAKLNTIIGSAD